MKPKTPKLLDDIRDAAAFDHGYDLVDPALVWSTIDNQVTVLLRDVGVLLGSAD